MKFLILTLFVFGFLPFVAEAKKQASDFKEVFSEDERGGETSLPEGTAPQSSSAVGTAPASSLEEGLPVLKKNEEILSGRVRVMRKIDRTEVFFLDLKDSYFLPGGSAYSSLYRAFAESQKNGQAVTFKVNTKSRQVLSLEENKSKTQPTTPATGSQ